MKDESVKPVSKPPPPAPPSRLYVDESLMAIDKPPGLAVGESPRALRAIVRALLPKTDPTPDSPLEPVHRLDKQASGVLLMARAPAAYESLMKQFQSGAASCVYEALVLGYVPDEAGEIDTPLIYDKRIGKMIAHRGRGREARTKWRLLERVAGHTLLECRPHPGLVHQVRVHLLDFGYPPAIDPLYGGGSQVLLSQFKSGYRSSSRHEERPLLQRLSLHLARIELEHPATGQRMEISSPRPRDLKATLTQLGRAL